MEQLSQWYEVARTWGIVADIILLLLFIYFCVQARELVPDHVPIRKKPKNIITLRKAEVMESWAKIMDSFTTGSAQGRKLAVIDADKMIDNILKVAGLPGESMMERLEAAKPEGLVSLGRVIRAHRLRNHIVHSQDFEPSVEEAEEAVSAYESFLKELQVL